MKQCPVCKSTYQDDSLTFCLSDGTKLVTGSAEPVTRQMSLLTNQARINIPVSEPTIQINSGYNQTQTEAPRKSYGLIIGVLATIFLIAAVVVTAAIVILYARKPDVAANVQPTPITIAAATPSPSASPDKSKELEEKLKQLEKELAEQKKSGKTIPSASPGQTSNPTSSAMAKVNSPNDGFLALRSEPSTQAGSQILKIPHGATVSLQNCEKTSTTISGRSGRWCEVEYNDQYGWVFSAWLDF